MVIKQYTVGVLLALVAGNACAGGFQLMEQNASGLGNAYAGAAAAAEDASTVFFNPAGMALLPGRQMVFAGHFILPSAQFSNTGSTAAALGFTAGPNGGDGGDLAFIPNFYLTWALDTRWTAGLGVNTPFGLTTDYDTNWVGRFHALRSSVRTVNVNPSLAYRMTDSWFIGAGLNWQRADAELTKAVNYSYIAAGSGVGGVAAGSAGTNRIAGHDDSWGFNLGTMFLPTPRTRVGLTYRSAVGHKLAGSVLYANRPAALEAALGSNTTAFNQAGDGDVTADIKMPASASVAVKHEINSRWDVLADFTWTEWRSFKSMVVVRSNGAKLEDSPQNWRNTWRTGVGVNYRADSQWTLRGGVAYDKSPVPEEYRTPRIPDQDRIWLALGAQYKVSRAGALDIGYAHIFIRDPQVAMTGPPSITAPQAQGRGSLVGNFNNRIDIVSVQYRHSF